MARGRWIAGTALAMLLPMSASARTLTVGPTGRDYTQLRDVFVANDLQPGDAVLVDGDTTYASVIVEDDDGGSAAAPVIIRWSGVGATRPRLQGGLHTIKFEQSNHVVFQGFEVTGGTTTCLFSEADDVTVRDVVIHGCPGHGILGADQNSGSFTLEYSEVYDAGAGTTKHAIYMQSDEVAYPAAVFTMRFNRVHQGNGGNLLKSRHRLSRIHYNWFEGAAYQELELIGPDCETQQAGWTAGLAREDADVVGNVFVHTSSWRNVARLGGDLNGRSEGRVRFLNNTFLIDRAGAANAVLVQLGLSTLQMDDNVVMQNGGAPAIVAENPATDVATPYCAPFDREPWTNGRRVAGRNNWVQTTATLVPLEWGMTRRGADPLFVDRAQRQLRPGAGSPLVDMGTWAPPVPAGYEVDGALERVGFEPPPRRKPALGERRARTALGGDIDIGAFEQVDPSDLRAWLQSRPRAAPVAPPMPIRPTRPRPPADAPPWWPRP